MLTCMLQGRHRPTRHHMGPRLTRPQPAMERIRAHRPLIFGVEARFHPRLLTLVPEAMLPVTAKRTKPIQA